MELWNETVPVRPAVKPLLPSSAAMPSLTDPEVQRAVTAVVVRLIGRPADERQTQFACMLRTARLEWEITLGALTDDADFETIFA